MWSIILNNSAGRFIKVICIATTSLLRSNVSGPRVTGIGRFDCNPNNNSGHLGHTRVFLGTAYGLLSCLPSTWYPRLSQVQDVPSVQGQPWTSKVVLDMVYGHHQSQVQDVPSVLGPPWTSKVVLDIVYDHHQNQIRQAITCN